MRVLIPVVMASVLAAACEREAQAPSPAVDDAGAATARAKQSVPQKLEAAKHDPNLKPGKVVWDPQRRKALEERGFTFDAYGNPVPPRRAE